MQAREAADTLPEQVNALLSEVEAARQRTEAAKQGTFVRRTALRPFRIRSRISFPSSSAAAARAAGADAKLSGAAAFAALYAERLGLRFAAGAPGEWAVVFTNVDPAAPDAEFRFALHVGDAAYTRALRLLALPAR